MSDLNYNVDDEISKYIDAYQIQKSGIGPRNLKSAPRRFNPITGEYDVLSRMQNGGYLKIGSEPLAMSEAPKQPSIVSQETEKMPDIGPQVESAMEYADTVKRKAGQVTADDMLAAGYDANTIKAIGIGADVEPMVLSTQEIEDRLRKGGSFLEYDPTIRETGRVELTQYLIELAEGSLAEDLRAQGIRALNPEADTDATLTEDQIATLIEGERPRLENEARSLSGMFFGDETTFGIGVGDFVTAGVMDIQEGARLFKQGLNNDSVADRSFGALLVLAGIAEATGVGMLVGKAIKKSIPTLRAGLADVSERLNQPGEMPTVGSNFGNVGQLNKPPLADSLPGRISTRLPTAKQIEEDPMSGELIIGLEEMKKDPKLFDFNVNITKDYPNMRLVEDETVDETSERFIEHVKDNLLYLHDQVPDATRTRSQKWYDGARAITDQWSEEYGAPDTSIAGVLAALSPQKDWYQNVSLAQRTLDVAIKQKDFIFADEMEQTFRSLPSLNKPKYEPMLNAIKGKSYTEIVDENPAVQSTLRALFVRLYDQTYNKPDYRIVGPEGNFLDIATNADGSPSKAAWGSLNEISKAVASIDANGDVNTISRLMGERHKVRNFYNNIYDPNSPFGDVTIDTHAVAAGLLRPLSGNSLEVDHNFKNMSVKGRGTTKGSAKTGVSGNYGLYAEAYRRAAAERGILPRQMQSITWEAVRGLFTDKFKQNAKNVTDINEIWQRYKNGEIELDETRRLVNERAGGVNAPSWE